MSVRSVAERLRSKKLTVTQAEAALRDLDATTTVEETLDAEETFTRMTEDATTPDENDTVHLDVLRTVGVVTVDEYERLVDALVGS